MQPISASHSTRVSTPITAISGPVLYVDGNIQWLRSAEKAA